METITLKNKSYTVSYHAQQRIAQRFAGLDLQEALTRGKFVDHNNVRQFGKFMYNKLNTMRQQYSDTARIIVNQYHNLAVALDVKTNVIITAMYADGTWSEC